MQWWSFHNYLTVIYPSQSEFTVNTIIDQTITDHYHIVLSVDQQCLLE
jgi:hypothetical protein